MSAEDLDCGLVLPGVTLRSGPVVQEWHIWHPVERRYRLVDRIVFADGEVLHLADDWPRVERPASGAADSTATAKTAKGVSDG